MTKPKFKIDDLVWMEDEFHFNPAYKVISIGKITAIHITRGKGMFVGEDKRGIIEYTILGFSIRPKEDQLGLYIEGENLLNG